MIKKFESYEIPEIEDPIVNIQNFKPIDIFMHYSGRIGVEDACYPYAKFMLKVLKPGKYIIFFGGRQDNEGQDVRGYIKRAFHAGGGVIKIVIEDGLYGGGWDLYPSTRIKVLDNEPEIKFNPDDPYGEEDWLDESKKIASPIFFDEPIIDKEKFNPYKDVFCYFYERSGVNVSVTKSYLKFMFDILKPGRYVIFQAGKNKQNVGERRGFIKKVSGRGKGSAIIDITLTSGYSFDETWSLLPSFDVKVMESNDELFIKHQAKEKRKSELKLKMKDIDPYGEEDWMEEGKSWRATEWFRRKRGDKIKVGDECLFVRDYLGSCGIEQYTGKKCIVDAIFSSDAIHVTFPPYNSVPFTVRETNLQPIVLNPEQIKKREEFKIKMKDIDPYGEENWLEENKLLENRQFSDFSIGDKVIYIYNGLANNLGTGESRDFYNMTAIVSDIKEWKGKYVGILFDDVDKFCKKVGQNLDNPPRMVYKYFVPFYCIDFLDPEKEIEKNRKKEELRLKMKDVDPYGEEEWLDESVQEMNYVGILEYCPSLEKEIKSFLKNYKRDALHYNLSHLDHIDLRESLEKILSGKKVKIGDQEFIANRFGSGYPDIYIMNSDREIRVNINSFNFCENPNETIKVKNTPRRFDDNDPYGEENWENESKINESDTWDVNLLSLRKKMIDKFREPMVIRNYHPDTTIQNDPDYLETVEKLVKNKIVRFTNYNYSSKQLSSEILLRVKELKFNATGTLIFNGELLNETDGRNICHDRDYLSFAVDEREKITVMDKGDMKKILKEIETEKQEKLLKIQKEKELKRLKHIDIDPYGEDDWE